MTDEQKKVLEAAGITDATDVSRYGSGHINETYKVETASGARYILQRVNTTIFDVDLLKTNVVRVTEFLKSKGVKSLEVVGYDNPWRIYKFLEGYTSRDVVSEPHQAYDVGRAFAKFQNDLADIPPPRLEEIDVEDRRVDALQDVAHARRGLDLVRLVDVAGTVARHVGRVNDAGRLENLLLFVSHFSKTFQRFLMTGICAAATDWPRRRKCSSGTMSSISSAVAG